MRFIIPKVGEIFRNKRSGNVKEITKVKKMANYNLSHGYLFSTKREDGGEWKGVIKTNLETFWNNYERVENV